MKPQTAIRFILVLAIAALLIGIGAFVWRQLNGVSNGPGQNAPVDFFSGLFPFNGSAGSRTSSNGEQSDSETDTRPVPRLRQVSARPVSGARFTEGGTIRFIEKETGHVFETAPDEYAITRLSNTTLPGIQDVVWTADDTFVLRSLSDDERVVNALGTLQGTSTDRRITIKPFGPFSRLQETPDGKSALTVTETENGSRIELIDFANVTSRLLLSSPLRSWVPKTGGTDLFLMTAPSENALGFLYRIEGQSLTRVAGGEFGFMATVSPSGRYVLYGGGVGNTVSLLDKFANATYSVSLPIIADKCAWFTESEPLLFCGIPENGLENLDAWLMGTASSADGAWVVEPVRDTAFFVQELTDENGRDIDVVHPEIDADGAHVLFMNKNDASLWSLRVDDAVTR